MFKTPILFLIYNRPQLTKKVFDQIRKVQPSKLFIASDGPKENSPEDQKLCPQTRKITEKIDWECKVKRLYRKKNLGCKKAVSGAIDWFFEHVDQGIILEDDCLPGQSFFYFCQTLLQKYKKDRRIMSISGNNFINGEKIVNHSYYFSKIPHIWGWATWKRAWKYYDVNVKTLPKFISQNQIKNVFTDKFVQKMWMGNFKKVYNHKIDTWDFQWTYAIFSQNGLCINPCKNLVTNIGFGSQATHTREQKNKFGKLKRNEIKEIIHPKFILPNKKADSLVLERNFGIQRQPKIFIKRLLKRCKLYKLYRSVFSKTKGQ